MFVVTQIVDLKNLHNAKKFLALNGLDYSAINFLYMYCLESRGGKPKLV